MEVAVRARLLSEKERREMGAKTCNCSGGTECVVLDACLRSILYLRLHNNTDFHQDRASGQTSGFLLSLRLWKDRQDLPFWDLIRIQDEDNEARLSSKAETDTQNT
jgi:hypothetical protein